MLGLIMELIISWLLLWIFFKKGLLVLGILPTQSRLFNLFFGILIAAVCGTLYFLSFSFFIANKWTLNNEFTGQKLLTSLWWTLKSVLYEELIFRGALLYILIKKLGVRTACITSAICFGVYHWFTSGALGNPSQMAIIFIMTGIWGAMFAMAFARTKSLYLPIGLHFGWNFLSTVIFSQGPLGKQLLIISGGHKLGEVLSAGVFIFQLLAVPIVTYWYLNLLSKKQKTAIGTGERQTRMRKSSYPIFKISICVLAVCFFAFFQISIVNWKISGYNFSHTWQTLMSDQLLRISFVDACAFTIVCLIWLWQDLHKNKIHKWLKYIVFIGTIIWGIPIFLLYLAFGRKKDR